MSDTDHVNLRSQKQPDVTIVVVSYNTAHLLDRLFASIEAARGSLSLQIIVIDNASTDGSRERLFIRSPGTELIQNEINIGFGRACNQAVPKAFGRYLLFLNSDAFMAPDTLQKTIDFMDGNSGYGILGVKLIGDDGVFLPSCRFFPTPWNFALNRRGVWIQKTFFPGTPLVDDFSWDQTAVRQCDWVPGCYYLVRKEVIEQVGLFDPRFFLYYEEIDYCRRAKEVGWNVVCYPHAQVVHLGGASAHSLGSLTMGMLAESELLYFRKYYGVSGALLAVLLGTFTSTLSAVKRLLRDSDFARVGRTAQFFWTRVRLLFATRLGARPTL